MKKTGTKNVSAINEAISNIESLTKVFKRKRMSEEQYIKRVNENLAKMTNERDYIDYLKNIGQF